MTLPVLTPLFVALGGAALLQLVLYLVMLRTRNAGIVDAGWATSIGLMGVGFALVYDGDPWRRGLLALIAGGWGLRLAWHLWTDRVIGQPEEGRYRRLREIWGENADRHFAWFFQAQALLAVLLAVPFAYAASARAEFPGALDLLALGLWLVGITGESIADRQLQAFKRDPDSKGRTCRRGLWRYSRHPNYFFEWVIWCAFGVLGLSAAGGWAGLIAPVLIYVFVNHLTGIPPTEAQAVRSRGEDYRRYQRTTSPFFPWPPREDPGPPSERPHPQETVS